MKSKIFLFYLEYYLEDAIQMLGFVPSLKEKKRKRDVDVDVEEEVFQTIMILSWA